LGVHDGFIPRQKWFVEAITNPLNGLTLDCGCASGLWSKELAKRGLNVVGLDLSKRRLKLSQKAGNKDLVCGSATNLPFKPSCFDSVVFLEIIEHMNQVNQNRALAAIENTLKTNGTIVITTPNKHIYQLFSKHLHLFPYNQEHIYELTLGEIKNMFSKHFKILLVDGKTGISFLDKIVPVYFCWDLLLVGKKVT